MWNRLPFSPALSLQRAHKILRATTISTKMNEKNKKVNNSRQAKCKPADVFLEGQWSVAIYKLYSEVFAKTVNILGMPHPRRPGGSQSGREKRREESFQVRTKELLGTDSHRTFSKNSSGCQLPSGHKKCFVLLCPIGEQFLRNSFREFIHNGYCSATLARLAQQACARKGNFYFLLS